MSSSDGLLFQCQLPAADIGSSAGLQQDLRYVLEAGDARTREFSRDRVDRTRNPGHQRAL